MATLVNYTRKTDPLSCSADENTFYIYKSLSFQPRGEREKLISVRLVIGSIFLFGLQVDGPVIVIKGSVCVCVCVCVGGGGGGLGEL